MDHRESIKKAMLKHEEIFKDQVQELHRLYRKQKLLMNDIDNRSTPRQPTRQKTEQTSCFDSQEAIKESEIQLTLGPSVYKSNQKRSSSGQSLSSSNSTGSSQIENTKIAPSRKDSTWEFTRSSQNSIQMNLAEDHLRHDRMKQQPPWMYQALTLKLS